MSIRPLKSGYERGKYKPVQAYIDTGVLSRFNKRHGGHGDITRLIRNAFVVAISENDETVKGAMRAAEQSLPDPPESETITIPCDKCAYRSVCMAEQQCVYREATMQRALQTTVV